MAGRSDLDRALDDSLEALTRLNHALELLDMGVVKVDVKAVPTLTGPKAVVSVRQLSLHGGGETELGSVMIPLT